MDKIFITGGTGTVGKNFISKYYNQYKFYSFARNEKSQVSLKRLFPNVEIIIGGIENETLLINEMVKVRPDIVIHAAALKHVDTAEKQPSQAVLTNIIGSYNLIKACILSNVKYTVGISTDKACSPDNIYGQTKAIMEKLFLEADSPRNKFACCRFGNVAWSNGSVIPLWLTRKANKEPLILTDERMTRLMFSADESSILIHRSIDEIRVQSGFIISKMMKTVKMKKMADLISNDVIISGMRPGEKLYENLISKKEIPFTYVKDEYIFIRQKENKDHETRLKNELSSKNAIEMNKKEMTDIIENISDIFSKKIIDEKNY